jgi:L-2-hydroxyglutarate oxidase LhgO
VASRTTADFVVVGAGIVGLALARELKRRQAGARIVVLEKEATLGCHASGRNSGVLHSGIYYEAGSVKGRMCAQGARELTEYCSKHRLPISRRGKVIVPVHEGEDPQLDVLLERARINGARAELLDERTLAALEPDTRSQSGRALYSPDTAVVEPTPILAKLHESLVDRGVEILLEHPVECVAGSGSSVRVRGETVEFGHLFNAAGLQADRVARAFGAGLGYAMLPFKGLYYRLVHESALRINGLVYPVPDLKVPFLGIHFTRAVNGHVDVGPTALPALGRENYEGLRGVSAIEVASIGSRILQLYVLNKQGFRRFAHREALRILKQRFVAAARALVPRLRSTDLARGDNVGIRAQLLNLRTHELVMDFVVEHVGRSTHILNAVSPAFTSAFPFARLVLDEAGIV